MLRTKIIRPYKGIEKAFGLDSLEIVAVKVIPAHINELLVKIKVINASKIDDFFRLNRLITNYLSEYENSYKTVYYIEFDKTASYFDVIKYTIAQMTLEKTGIVPLLLNYELITDISGIIVKLPSKLQVKECLDNMIDIELRKKIEKIYPDRKVSITFKEQGEKEKEVVEKKKVEPEKVLIVDLSVGKFIESSGEVFDIVEKEIKTRTGLFKKILTFYITDYNTSLSCRKFYNIDDNIGISIGDIVTVKGTYKKDDAYTREYYVDTKSIVKTGVANHEIVDTAPKKRVELNIKTNMSEMYANINPKKLSSMLEHIGYTSYAVADIGVVHAFPFLYNNSSENMKVIFGVDAFMVDDAEQLVVNPSDNSIKDETYVVFDIETTGLSPYNDKIIEIGAVKVKNFDVIDTYSVFINPEIPLSEFTTQLTSITNEDVKNAKTIDQILPEFLEFIGQATLVAQNAKFDVGFMYEKSRQLGIDVNFKYIDTIQWARLTIPDQKKFNLDALCKRFGVVNEHHHRAINDAEVTAKIFKCLMELVIKMGANTLKDVNNLHIDDKIAPVKKTTILVKNKRGLKTLYKLISESFLDYFGNSKPRIPKSVLTENREDFLISPSPSYGFNESGELVELYFRGLPKEYIEQKAKYYDYIQLLPVSCYEKEIKEGEVSSEDQIQEMNRYFYTLGKKLGKKVVAVGNTMYMHKYEYKSKSVLQIANADFKAAKYNANAHFRTTTDMLEEFKYMGEDVAYEIVVENTNDISDSIDRIQPIPSGFYPPKIDGDREMVKKLTYDKAYELYGENIPELIKKRIEKELNAIINNGFAVLYLIAQKLVKKSVDNGYLVGSRGSVGSSIVAYLMGITEVNGLSPHYRCPNKECKNIEIYDLETSGVDLPEKNCPKCGTKYIRDGHAIPFEVFMGFNGEKVPDIDLNFSSEYQSEIHKYTEEIFGKKFVFRAGTISTTAKNNAIGYAKKYYEETLKDFLKKESIKKFGVFENTPIQDNFRDTLLKNELSKNMAEIVRLAKLIEGTRKTTGQHPGGMVVIPNDMSVFDFTPIQKPANDLTSDSTTTHFDYHVMDAQLVKLDILGHDDPTTLKILEDLTGISPYTLPLTDPKVLSLFTSTKALGVTPEQIGTELGTNGIPEFGTNFVKEMLKDTKPTTFTELVRISGLSHGTDVWLNNAKDYINANVASLSEVITVRDDIMNYLILQGMDKSLAFKIMEFVRRGKPSKLKEQWEEYKKEMRKSGAKEWYIESCEKIKYMFPKGHAVAYVMMAIRIAYFKVYYPLEFYTAYLNRKISSFTMSKMFKPVEKLKERLKELDMIANKNANDKAEFALLEILIEMHYRGIELLPVDLEKSAARSFIINDGKIRIPFIAIDQLGEIAATNIVKARQVKAFTSQEDLMKRAGINNSVMETLRKYNIITNLSLTEQQTLF